MFKLAVVEVTPKRWSHRWRNDSARYVFMSIELITVRLGGVSRCCACALAELIREEEEILKKEVRLFVLVLASC